MLLTNADDLLCLQLHTMGCHCFLSSFTINAILGAVYGLLVIHMLLALVHCTAANAFKVIVDL
jgi:hypothetical protein